MLTKFNNLGIGTRLIGGFLLLAVTCAAVGFWGIRSMTQINQALESVSGTLLPSTRSLTDLRSALSTVQRTERSALMAARSKDEAAQKQAVGAQGEAWAKAREAMARYEALPQEEKEKQLWGEFRPLLEQFRQDNEATMTAFRVGNLDRAEKLCLGSVANGTRMSANLNALCDLQDEFAARDTRAAQEQFASARTTMFAVIGVAVFTAVALGVFFRNLIVRPLTATIKVLQAVAAGDLGQKIEVKAHDEFGQMGVALNATVQGIRTALDLEKVDWVAVGKQREQNADYALRVQD